MSVGTRDLTSFASFFRDSQSRLLGNKSPSCITRRRLEHVVTWMLPILPVPAGILGTDTAGPSRLTCMSVQRIEGVLVQMGNARPHAAPNQPALPSLVAGSVAGTWSIFPPPPDGTAVLDPNENLYSTSG